MVLHGQCMDRYLHERYFSIDHGVLGRVHSVFRSVINIETKTKEIFSLSHLRDAYMPFMIQVKERKDFLMESDLQGIEVTLEGGRVSIGNAMDIDLRGIEITDRGFKTQKITDKVSESIERARVILLENGKRGGCLSYYGQYKDMDLMEKELAKRIGSLETRMDFEKLMGFGRGLTPSGDDFLLGFLCAARSIRHATMNTSTIKTRNTAISREDKEIEKMIRKLKETVSRKGHDTTDVSRQMLMQGLDDQFNGPLMDLCEWITAGESHAACRDSMLKLLNIGSTSGADMATGVIYALEMTFKNETNGGSYV